MENVKRTSLLVLIVFVCVTFCVGVSRAEPVRYDRFNVIYFDSVPYISLVDLSEIYRVKVTYDPRLLSMTAEQGEKRLTCAHLSRIAFLNGASRNIILPARLLRGTIFAPIPTFLPLFSELLPGTLTWDEKKRLVRADGVLTTIQKVRFENFKNGTLIRIILNESLKHEIELIQNNWLTVNFGENGSFAPDTLFARNTGTLVRDMRSFQYEDGAQLAFRLSDGVDDYSVSSTSSTNEILISLYKKRTAEPVAVTTQPDFTIPVNPDVDNRIWRIDTIIIDPGHGGRDPGAVGPNKTQEKDIVLKVAQELKSLIDKGGVMKAFLTRDKDVFVPFHRRTQIAKEKNGKLFISIHANASKNRQAKGTEIFFLSVAKTDDAREVAERENKSINYEENLNNNYPKLLNNSSLSSYMMNIEMGMASSVYLKESQDMCRIMLDKTCTATKQKRRGVKQAGFIVMVGTQAFMPSVLFEIGFISNPEEEKLLNRVSYQKRLAQAMYGAIMDFKQTHESGLFSQSE